MKKITKITVGFLTAGLLFLLTACGRAEAETAIDAKTESRTEAAVEEETESAPSAETKPEADGAPQEADTPSARTVTCEQEGVFMSAVIPDGWEYTVRTAEDTEPEENGMLCTIDFWPESAPEAVFSLGYQPQKFGICGTEVTTEAFTLPNGMNGTMFTEVIEDTLWLTVVYQTGESQNHGGTYLIMASPDVSVWETAEQDFLRIRDSVQVGDASAQ